MFRYLLIAFLVTLSAGAKADCVEHAVQLKKGNVIQTWPAKHVNEGDLGGCLLKLKLKSGGEVFAYTRYNFVCTLKPEEEIQLLPDYACCDTGDQGDFACGVKARGLFDNLPRTNITLTPFPDVRAIPDMVDALLKGGKLRDASAAVRLTQYLGDPALAEEVKKQIVPLETALDKNTITEPYVRAQVAGLLAAAYPASPSKTGWLVESFKGDIGYALTDTQKSLLVSLTSDAATADRFIPVLVQKLRSTDEAGKQAILSAIVSYGAAAKPHATALRDALSSELPTDWDKPVEAPATPPKDDIEAARRMAMMKEVAKVEAEKEARVKTLLPLLATIACHGEAGKVTIGKNYPSTIDCKKP